MGGTSERGVPMSTTLHCPLCGLRFRYGSEYDVHVREDHAPPARLHRPPPKQRADVAAPQSDQEPVLHRP